MMTTEQWYAANCPPDSAICHYHINDETEDCGSLTAYTLTLRGGGGAAENVGVCSLHAALASATARPGQILAVQPTPWATAAWAVTA